MAARAKAVSTPRRYVALLRGVSPVNCKMAELKAAFERAGFGDVKTVLSSGNVVFSAEPSAEDELARRAEAAMKAQWGSGFLTFVRSVDDLRALLGRDPYARHRVPANAKRVVTFLAAPPERKPKLPVEQDGARILSLDGREAFSAYVPSPRGPVFMTLLQKTFGKDITTRTWETVSKLVR